jgi:hypothetical protein
MPSEDKKASLQEWAKILGPVLLASGFFGGREVLETKTEGEQAAVVDTFKEAAYEWEVKFHLLELDIEDVKRRVASLEQE